MFKASKHKHRRIPCTCYLLSQWLRAVEWVDRKKERQFIVLTAFLKISIYIFKHRKMQKFLIYLSIYFYSHIFTYVVS